MVDREGAMDVWAGEGAVVERRRREKHKIRKGVEKRGVGDAV